MRTEGDQAVAGERFLAHPRRAVRAGGLILLAYATIAALVPVGPFPLDESWSDAMRRMHTPRLEQLALRFDWLGRAVGVIMLLLAVGLILGWARRWLALITFAVAEGTSAVLSAVSKALLERPRPPDGVLHPISTSFPSGHTSYASVTCVALVLLFTRPGAGRRAWWIAALLGIAGMGWSRTFLHVHWLSDVIAGGLLGAGVALVVFGGAQLRAPRR